MENKVLKFFESFCILFINKDLFSEKLKERKISLKILTKIRH